MALAGDHIKTLIENNLDYAELLLVPEPTGLELINKDAGLGNIDSRQQSLLLAWFNSFHRLQKFTKPIQILMRVIKDQENDKEIHIPINPIQYTKKDIDKEIAAGTMKIVIQEVPRYPFAFQDLKSRIASMLITSGSVEGFRAILQHSTIHKTKQEQTLEEIQNSKKLKWGKKKK